MDSLMATFEGIFKNGVSVAVGMAMGTFALVAAIDFIWKVLTTLLSEENQIALLIRCSVKYGMISALIKNYAEWSQLFQDSLMKVGAAVGGGSVSAAEMKLPGTLFLKGMDNLQPILQTAFNAKISLTSLDGFFIGIMLLIIYVLGLLCYLIIAAQMFLCWMEWYIIGACAVVFLPFLANSNTKFMGEKAIGAVVATAVKLMVLCVVLSAIVPVLTELVIPTDPKNKQLWVAIGTMLLMSLLAWLAPGMASGLLAGSPSIGGSETATTAKNTGGNVMSAGGAAKSGATAAYKAATNPSVVKNATAISHNLPG